MLIYLISLTSNLTITFTIIFSFHLQKRNKFNREIASTSYYHYDYLAVFLVVSTFNFCIQCRMKMSNTMNVTWIHFILTLTPFFLFLSWWSSCFPLFFSRIHCLSAFTFWRKICNLTTFFCNLIWDTCNFLEVRNIHLTV